MLTTDRLREVLHYDPATGVFRWRVGNGRRAVAGHEAGCAHAKGYRRIRIDGGIYEAHRLAWLWMRGEWPAQQIDHRDLDKANNAWSNLRAATRSQNAANSIRVGRDLPKGVTRTNSGYQARITSDGEMIHLGVFGTAFEAARMYAAAAHDLFGEYARAS